MKSNQISAAVAAMERAAVFIRANAPFSMERIDLTTSLCLLARELERELSYLPPLEVINDSNNNNKEQLQ